jgi:hypothetical protein
MPRTKPKVNPNRGHVAGEKLIRKNTKSRAFLLFGQIAPLVAMERKLPYNRQNLAVQCVTVTALPAPESRKDSKIAFMAPADLWFSTDANELYCADDEEIYEPAT